jgi:hypothetical protein
MEIKEFWKKHKKKIIFVGCLAGAVTYGVLVSRQLGMEKRKFAHLTGKTVLSWVQPEGFMNLERVKEILDLNAETSSSFAILKEGPDPNAYIAILISDNVLLNKV